MKRTYGLPIDLCEQTLGATNLETGTKSITYTKIRIQRAIIQPARSHRDFVYDLAFISANKDFTTGGFFDASDRRIILDANDVPDDWDIDINQFVIFNNKRYDIKSFDTFESNAGYTLIVRETTGQKIVRLENTSSVLTLVQTVVRS